MADGSVHEGLWQRNVANGAGTRTSFNGSRAEGEWKDGVLQGRGMEEVRDESGSVWVEGYDGEFTKGLRSGAGTLVNADGGTYDGMWLEGRQHGVGRYTAADGWSYRGAWRYGRRHGNGVLTSTQLHRFSGEWVEDHLPLGVLTGKFLGRCARPSMRRAHATLYTGWRALVVNCAARALVLVARLTVARSRFWSRAHAVPRSLASSRALSPCHALSRLVTRSLACHSATRATSSPRASPNGPLSVRGVACGWDCAATPTMASGRMTTTMVWVSSGRSLQCMKAALSAARGMGARAHTACPHRPLRTPAPHRPHRTLRTPAPHRPHRTARTAPPAPHRPHRSARTHERAPRRSRAQPHTHAHRPEAVRRMGGALTAALL